MPNGCRFEPHCNRPTISECLKGALYTNELTFGTARSCRSMPHGLLERAFGLAQLFHAFGTVFNADIELGREGKLATRFQTNKSRSLRLIAEMAQRDFLARPGI